MICDTLGDNTLYHDEEAFPLIELGWLMIRARERWLAIRDAFHAADVLGLREKFAIYRECRTPKLAAVLQMGAKREQKEWESFGAVIRGAINVG